MTDWGARLQGLLDRADSSVTEAELLDTLSKAYVTMAATIVTLNTRIDRLEAAVVIQTGTVFGAQGDSDRMTIEHTIPEPPLNDWKA